ncbi:MAG: hypothetical protein WA793_10580 [Sphingorhabdus sp.]|uniref:hypothetical protein n=1 Tax=Sphingorhabdus sp. TaxID=1902408 RepID=UPI0032BE5AAC
MISRVLIEEIDVVYRLHQLRIPKDELLEILDRAAGERANVNANDPSGTLGIEMRRWATRFLRESPRLIEMGWVACAHSQVEGIRNDALAMKVAFTNTDAATGMPSKSPHSIAEKGPVSESLIRRNYVVDQGVLFVEPEPIDPILKYDFWYLCANVTRDSISAELSRPVGTKNGIVCEFSERLILLQPGESGRYSRRDPVPVDFAEIDKPSISRKG